MARRRGGTAGGRADSVMESEKGSLYEDNEMTSFPAA